MSESIQMEGRTVEEAVNAALSVLGAQRGEVDVKVLEEGTQGVFGVFGAKPAQVEVMKKGMLGERVKTYVQEILDTMALIAVVAVTSETEGKIYLDIRSEDLGRVIGKGGALLEALQELASGAASKLAKRRVNVVLDASGYRERQERKLVRLAKETAETVQKTGHSVTLPPMNNGERKMIHEALQHHPRVGSYSKGERNSRCVVICTKEEAAVHGPVRERGPRRREHPVQPNETEQMV